MPTLDSLKNFIQRRRSSSTSSDPTNQHDENVAENMAPNNNNKPIEKNQAASTIQKNFRGYKDRLKAREQAAFNINQLIEFSEEQDHLNLNRFKFNRVNLIHK